MPFMSGKRACPEMVWNPVLLVQEAGDTRTVQTLGSASCTQAFAAGLSGGDAGGESTLAGVALGIDIAHGSTAAKFGVAEQGQGSFVQLLGKAGVEGAVRKQRGAYRRVMFGAIGHGPTTSRRFC
jgi:hypothetical protein